MPSCVVVNVTTGALELGAPGCTGTALVALTVDEYAALSASPWNLTNADASEISFLIIGTWAVALLTRALIRALQAGDVAGNEREV
jgi:hypothetical protein